ncbi:MAG: hypothetical protein IKI64_03735 [Clostridia bacterium]|nr:hypothetical protein [Clostridia bacterium]
MNNRIKSRSLVRSAAALMLALAMLLCFFGCGGYKSKYKAVGFVHSNDTESANMSFYTFEGRMVFKLKANSESDIKYSAKLESGSATVYYDWHGKQELFSVKGGEELDLRGGYVDNGTIHIIVETDGECMNGEFSFWINAPREAVSE